MTPRSRDTGKCLRVPGAGGTVTPPLRKARRADFPPTKAQLSVFPLRRIIMGAQALRPQALPLRGVTPDGVEG